MLKECYFKQNYTPKLFIAFKMAYYCHFSLGGNLDFLDFLQKKFYNIYYCCIMYGKFKNCFVNVNEKHCFTKQPIFC